MDGYLRGQVAKLADVNIETLRYYENYGLIAAPTRSESGYRLYSKEVLTRLTFIKNAKLCGFTLKEIKKALTKSSNKEIHIEDFVSVIERKVDRIHAEIAGLEQTKARLNDLKTHLEAVKKHPGVTEVLQILNMES
ncbi:MerR family transcriptional regulator [Fontibacillus sp. BL9]|uniref:MerR family transcriptional regulator n=1 Tax=Fontibacillus sp. BL9 TaxID=3389971 RepID=UPI0039784A30